MRRKNESALLSIVRRFPGVSSADIARRSGLAPQTVSVLLKGLEAQRVVKRGAVLRGRRGQPAVPILIDPEGGYGIGVEIAWRHADVVLLNLRGEVLAHRHWEVQFHQADVLIGEVVSAVRAMVGVLPGKALPFIKGIGIAMPTSMHVNLHTLGACKREAEAMMQLNILSELRASFPFDVALVNDGTAACRAECTYGRGARYGDMVHIFISTYVGAGIFVDGRVIEGRSGDAASIGAAMVPAANGNIQALHTVASVKALENRIFAAGKSVPRISVSDWDWAAIAPEVEAWIEEAAGALALAIANSCTVIDFSAALIDGILPAPLLDRLAERVRMRMSKLPIAAFEPPMIVRGEMGSSAPAIGAANLPLYLAVFAPENANSV